MKKLLFIATAMALLLFMKGNATAVNTTGSDTDSVFVPTVINVVDSGEQL